MAPGRQRGGECEFGVDRPRAIDCFKRSFIRRPRQFRCIAKRAHREVIGSTIMCALAVGVHCLCPTQPDWQCTDDALDDAVLQCHMVFGLAFKRIAPEMTSCRYLE